MTPCQKWPHSLNRYGYGQVRVGGTVRVAHRVLWEAAYGPVPDGMQLDHLCRNRACVNLEHLEVVSPRENWRRGQSPTRLNALKTHCLRGHALTPERTHILPNGRRRCRTCHALREANRKAVRS